ncbi:MAG TPA: ATP-binding protein [Rhabdochlamydiaceae bacterium]|nr:ATP-binding protein [Rhabdochlamydiaceae bacterium]
MKETISCREKEIQILDQIWASKEAEFLAIYGRRRVGKTYLIREYFSNKKSAYLEITGQKDGNLKDQLENFIRIFSTLFFNDLPLRPPATWKEAFELLTKEIDKSSQPVVLFFDELPWLATPKSGMLQALDYYWNRFWNQHPKLILVVCGSAASWMLDNLINAKGGLHNRLTKTILLKPYSLKEAQQFLSYRNIHLKPKQLLDLYMVFGGIPYYLRYVEKGKSSLQTVNKICFQREGLLYEEFDRLFRSLFENASDNLSIIRAIAKGQIGISREELVKTTGFRSGGTLNKRLRELETAGFIQSYIPYGRKIKDHYYRVIDEYCYFYLRWIEPFKKRGIEGGKEYWQTKGKTPAALTWAGYAFENICLKHIDQIRHALDLQAISCDIGNWRFIPPQKQQASGAQIDLLFDREDGIITLCEIKYTDKLFILDKSQAKILMNKIEVFENYFSPKKQILFALISTNGLKQTAWSEDLIHNVVTLTDLLKF